jgi:hypothetical protein
MIERPSIMPPALAEALGDYSRELVPFAIATGDRVALAMVASCDFLLIEAARLEGSGNG